VNLSRAHRALRRAGRPEDPDSPAPTWRDGLLALVIFLISAAHWPRPQAGPPIVSLLLVALLPWRRRAPVAVFAALWVIAAVGMVLVGPVFADCTLLIALYTVAVSASRRAAGLAAAALEAGIVLAVIDQSGSPAPAGRLFVGLTGLAVAAGVLGINVGNRRQILAALRERAERMEAERERELALATASERARIAREMHDVVAHNLSVMIALCDGAAYHVHDAPDRVASALDQASQAGRRALGEMRQLLGVLRDAPTPGTPGTPASVAVTAPDRLTPQPGRRQLGELVERLRAAGLPVTFADRGRPGDLPAGLELAVYRIVQEALTNTLKHAGPGATAAVHVTWHERAVELEVTDTGAVPAGSTHTGGAGLRGMGERAAVYGGHLEAGPRPGGGWRVATVLQVPADVAVSAP
jgi:signal transduction histidine kinase